MHPAVIVIIGMLFFPLMFGAVMGYLFMSIVAFLTRLVGAWRW